MEYRHQLWRVWFIDRLEHHGNNVDALCPTLEEWFSSDDFRDCAFINSVGELGGVLPEVVMITRRHKQDMSDIIATLLPPSQHRKQDVEAVALAVDGAIMRAQFDQTTKAATTPLQRILEALHHSKNKTC